MAIVYTDRLDGIDWNALAALFNRAGLGQRTPALIEATFRGSQLVAFAHDQGRLVGAGRALSDRVAWTAIFDVAVDPHAQGQGIGGALMRLIRERAATPNFMLKSMPGKEPFYAGLGFVPMPTGMECASVDPGAA
ncbi:Acetyltransferase (GNAT) domain-containing protein [Pseudoxanthomonas sp. GM95]|uniref:GNAT family N-acetyltransferase n=1 Tax=Pseudoxanthomonas sp. GM95 TaxID=1881043 RepID=UPI0008AB1F9E|nr:GNAT family N-acetyltransferase [Pseudoxanthomonas sp. GM95]SEL75072.1 Acetyltransferase (GNAT) domain-containing protein [Pseudoxanthomonas sp. GM95]